MEQYVIRGGRLGYERLGDVTFELARRAAPGGRVTGVDMDEVKLNLARQPPRRRGCSTWSSGR